MTPHPQTVSHAYRSRRRWLLVGTALAVGTVMLVAAHGLIRSYVIGQAERRVRDVMLECRALHEYVQRDMHPALQRLKAEGRVPEDFYSPELLSSSYIARRLHHHFNEERRQTGLPEVRYRLAAVDPRNPVNEATAFEAGLIEQFNQDHDQECFRDIIEVDGRKHLYYATPFLAVQPRCLRCHGAPEAVPAQLGQRYRSGGYHRRVGEVVAMESISSPLEAEFATSNTVFVVLLAVSATIAILLLVNTRLHSLVRRHTAALRASEERFRGLTENASDLIAILTGEGALSYISPSSGQVLGYPPEELAGRRLNDLTHPEDASLLGEHLDAAAHRPGAVLSPPVFRLRHRDGHWVFMEGVVTALLDTPGIEGVVFSGRDISERRRVEQELNRYQEHLEHLVETRTAELETAQEELLRSERLAVLGQLTATVSHELRNPLGTIRSSFFAIEEQVRGKGLGVERALERVERNIRRCDGIIAELLDYARVTPLRRQATNLDHWVERLLAEQALPAGVELVLRLNGGAEVAIDRERMQRCVTNVVTNAVQAMQEGGPEGRLTVETARQSGRLEVQFRDTGPGIPPDHLDRLFEPLYSTKSFGVGLGLPIVRQIMEQHNGGVEIQSEPGQGTVVTLWLPLG